MVQIRRGEGGDVLYTIRRLLNTSVSNFQCDIYKGDFSESSQARHLREYKFHANDPENKRLLKNAKDETLAMWNVDAQDEKFYWIVVAPGVDASLAVAMMCSGHCMEFA